MTTVRERILSLLDEDWNSMKIDNEHYQAIVYFKEDFDKTEYGFSDGSSKTIKGKHLNSGAFIAINKNEDICAFCFMVLKNNIKLSNNKAEYYAAKLCSDFVNKDGVVLSDSTYACNKNKKEGIENIYYIPGHNGNSYNIMVDILSKMASSGLLPLVLNKWLNALGNRNFLYQDFRTILTPPESLKEKYQRIKLSRKEIAPEKKKKFIEECQIVFNYKIEKIEMEKKLFKEKCSNFLKIDSDDRNLNIIHKAMGEDCRIQTFFNDDYHIFRSEVKYKSKNTLECLLNYDIVNKNVSFVVLDGDNIQDMFSVIWNNTEVPFLEEIENVIHIIESTYPDIYIYSSEQEYKDVLNEKYNIISLSSKNRLKHYHDIENPFHILNKSFIELKYGKNEFSFKNLIKNNQLLFKMNNLNFKQKIEKFDFKEELSYEEICNNFSNSVKNIKNYNDFEYNDSLIISFQNNEDYQNLGCIIQYNYKTFLYNYIVYDVENYFIKETGYTLWRPDMVDILKDIQSYVSEKYDCETVFYLNNFHFFASEYQDNGIDYILDLENDFLQKIVLPFFKKPHNFLCEKLYLDYNDKNKVLNTENTLKM